MEVDAFDGNAGVDGFAGIADVVLDVVNIDVLDDGIGEIIGAGIDIGGRRIDGTGLAVKVDADEAVFVVEVSVYVDVESWLLFEEVVDYELKAILLDPPLLLFCCSCGPLLFVRDIDADDADVIVLVDANVVDAVTLLLVVDIPFI